MLRRLILLVLFMVSVAVHAGPEGRYQAIAIDPGIEYGTEKALVVDTVAGHLWIWLESAAAEGEPGGRYLIYQGQLEPGEEMGQIMHKQEWPAKAD